MKHGGACPDCGRPSVVVTVRATAGLVVLRCPRCERRTWTVGGVEASLDDVVGLLRREHRDRVRQAGGSASERRAERAPAGSGHDEIDGGAIWG